MPNEIFDARCPFALFILNIFVWWSNWGARPRILEFEKFQYGLINRISNDESDWNNVKLYSWSTRPGKLLMYNFWRLSKIYSNSQLKWANEITARSKPANMMKTRSRKLVDPLKIRGHRECDQRWCFQLPIGTINIFQLCYKTVPKMLTGVWLVSHLEFDRGVISSVYCITEFDCDM